MTRLVEALLGWMVTRLFRWFGMAAYTVDEGAAILRDQMEFWTGDDE